MTIQSLKIKKMLNNNITIVLGTNRTASLTEKVGRYYASLVQEHGKQTTLLSLTQLPIDFTFNALYEHNGKNKKFNQLQQIIATTSHFICIVPEYNGSFPGVLKAFIDGLSFPHTLQNKQCALVGISQGPQGGILALSHLTDIFHYLGVYVHPLKIKLANLKNGLTSVTENPLFIQLLKKQIVDFIP